MASSVSLPVLHHLDWALAVPVLALAIVVISSGLLALMGRCGLLNEYPGEKVPSCICREAIGSYM